ncbi:uncharacterized protein LOC143469011 [Clavelina lepadiformis]|uniref:Uncharacterized protein n=1 Tax=Clavelina lepadiformis TaxID=159417 RepID=A0ABP0F0Y9_CLALP
MTPSNKQIFFFAAIILTGCDRACSFKNCFYCNPKSLGYCAHQEITMQEEHCEDHDLSSCHSITSFTVHTKERLTLIKRCNQTISECHPVKTDNGNLLLCCSKCNSARVQNPRKGWFLITTLAISLIFRWL